MKYVPTDGTWVVLPSAGGIQKCRDLFDAETYAQSKSALQKFLCGYFSSGDCDHKLGKSISPLGATPNGGKILKVRWGLPGTGKSGGLRLCVVAYCAEKRVVIAEAFLRKDDPGDGEFTQAVSQLP